MGRILLSIALALALAACGAAPGELSHEYGKSARKVGLYPIYPPREEFQIGDVYAWSQSRTNANDTIAVYVKTLDWLRHEADRFMATRIVFENSTATDPEKPFVRTNRDTPAGKHGLTLRGDLSPSSDLGGSLPIAAFPSITADAGFTAGVGIVRLLTAIGLAGGARTQVTLNFNDVRTYWAPNVEVAGRAIEDRNAAYRDNRDVIDFELRRMAEYRLGSGVDPCRGARHCGISVVTRVYLTRKIDYTYRNARIVAGALRTAEPGFKRADVPAAPAVTVNVTSANGEIDAAAIDTQVAAIRTQLDQLTAAEGQGASLRFEAWDARGMTFASEYLRPVVVGWDGLSATIVIRNGRT
jgi:hypothetical protein